MEHRHRPTGIEGKRWQNPPVVLGISQGFVSVDGIAGGGIPARSVYLSILSLFREEASRGLWAEGMIGVGRPELDSV